jgi:hypothetical protein
MGETRAVVQKYMEENLFQFPVVLYESNSLRSVYAPRTPTTYILNQDGGIIARINGSHQWDSEEAIRILNYLIPVL